LETNACANFNPSDVTPTDLREFKQFLLINKEMKPASVNRRLASLRSLLKWANEVGISPDFQLSKIPKFEKTEKTGIRWLDRKEENALLRSVERVAAKRDIAIIKLKTSAISSRSNATAAPIAPIPQMFAAVARPRTFAPSLRIAPPPIKPMPPIKP